MDETGKLISAAVDTPTSVDATANAAPSGSINGWSSTNYQGMAVHVTDGAGIHQQVLLLIRWRKFYT